MKKNSKIENDDFITPSKCAESPLTRWDGGIKSEDAAQANLAAGADGNDPEPDWVESCALNQTTKAGKISHAPVQGGPSGHFEHGRAKGKSI